MRSNDIASIRLETIKADMYFAGAFLLCPEYRYLSRGFEYIDSFSVNAHKALPINFDCSPMWYLSCQIVILISIINKNFGVSM